MSSVRISSARFLATPLETNASLALESSASNAAASASAEDFRSLAAFSSIPTELSFFWSCARSRDSATSSCIHRKRTPQGADARATAGIVRTGGSVSIRAPRADLVTGLERVSSLRWPDTPRTERGVCCERGVCGERGVLVLCSSGIPKGKRKPQGQSQSPDLEAAVCRPRGVGNSLEGASAGTAEDHATIRRACLEGTGCEGRSGQDSCSLEDASCSPSSLLWLPSPKEAKLASTCSRTLGTAPKLFGSKFKIRATKPSSANMRLQRGQSFCSLIFTDGIF
mmetsp:Transcript_88133/g.174905  ORF Transcript_88133/g.174905 Transcript_88133/m.174905 type:complete len:282 (+) Transcript_88133:215-1060(+)